MADAGGLALWSPGLGPGVTVVGSVTGSGTVHDSLEGISGVDSLAGISAKEHTGSDVVEEEDPLAEFEAWIASGAVQIVDKL